MPKIVIFGNSGSGKSTLARNKAMAHSCPHLDLDTVAWDEDNSHDVPTRKPLAASLKQLESFLADNGNWVVEGCYADLLGLVLPYSTEIIFLNPGKKTCIENCKNRPWEPHKYESPEAQDANLDMLIGWIEQYEQRVDEFSLQAHQGLFNAYKGKKLEYLSNAPNG